MCNADPDANADANVPTDLVGGSQRAESCGASGWRLFPG
jgi:hypothetical protein